MAIKIRATKKCKDIFCDSKQNKLHYVLTNIELNLKKLRVNETPRKYLGYF